MKIVRINYTDMDTRNIFVFNVQDFNEIKYCQQKNSLYIRFGQTEIYGFCEEICILSLEEFLTTETWGERSPPMIFEIMAYSHVKWNLFTKKNIPSKEEAEEVQKALTEFMPKN